MYLRCMFFQSNQFMESIQNEMLRFCVKLVLRYAWSLHLLKAYALYSLNTNFSKIIRNLLLLLQNTINQLPKGRR